MGDRFGARQGQGNVCVIRYRYLFNTMQLEMIVSIFVLVTNISIEY